MLYELSMYITKLSNSELLILLGVDKLPGAIPLKLTPRTLGKGGTNVEFEILPDTPR